jgi:4-amino-4-deoxy-L-arabinose transferase-like glycosyltransferase
VVPYRFADRAFRHGQVVEGHGGPLWVYLTDMPKFFGELIYVPVVWLVVRSWRRPVPIGRAVAAWVIVPYVVFSLLPTKLPAFIAIAAPGLFLIQAAFWERLRERPVQRRDRGV